MNTILLALALALQPQPEQPQPQPLPSDGLPPIVASPANDAFYAESAAGTPEARAAMHRFGNCAAGNSGALATETLNRDFRSPAYRSALRRLARNNETCFRQSGMRMQSGGLLFAGAMAEGLLKRDAQPLNVRLARAALQPAIRAYSATDRVAICIVRSVPDEVSRLIGSEPASAAEGQAIGAIRPVLQPCAQGGPPLRINTAGLRAIIATAAFRSVHAAAPFSVARK